MKIIFAGTPIFAIPFLTALHDCVEHKIIAVCTQPDRRAGRGQKLTASPVKEKSLEFHLPILQPEDWRTRELEQQLRELEPDILLDVACGALLPPNILSLPRYGCINVHPSLLPRWRGAAPLQRAILAGDEASGITIMQMNSGLDSGDVLSQVRIAITAQITTSILTAKLIKLGIPLLLQTLRNIENGMITCLKQDDTSSTYATKITKEEAHIDWSLSVEQIDRKVRAFNPVPIAHTTIDAYQIKIWQSAIITSTMPALQRDCGAIVNIAPNGIDVTTGNGVLRILRLQLPGKKMMLAKDVVHGHPQMFKIGNKFI